jgi:hypothetical protein
MTERNIDQVRQAAKDALLQGTSGSEVALLFKAADIALEQAETEMRALGFFAQAVTNSEVTRLYVSQGISQQGIATLLQSFQYSRLPSVIWDSISPRPSRQGINHMVTEGSHVLLQSTARQSRGEIKF